MNEELTDEALMAAYQGGSTPAFELLFQRHRMPLFTLLVHQLGNRSAAEDLFQDIFLRLIAKRASYAPGRNFRAWLYTIARNALVDSHRRSEVRSSTLEAHMQSKRMELDKSAAADPTGQLEHSELKTDIEAALARLPHEQREVFLLRERAGLDYASIASVLGCGISTAKSRMRYALEGLRHQLKP